MQLLSSLFTFLYPFLKPFLSSALQTCFAPTFTFTPLSFLFFCASGVAWWKMGTLYTCSSCSFMERFILATAMKLVFWITTPSHPRQHDNAPINSSIIWPYWLQLVEAVAPKHLEGTNLGMLNIAFKLALEVRSNSNTLLIHGWCFYWVQWRVTVVLSLEEIAFMCAA